MMSKVPTPLPGNASLDQQIRMVEQRLRRRRATSRLRVARFRSQVKASITSPLALLVATGVGFTIGHTTLSKGAASTSDASPDASLVPSGIHLVPTLVSIVSLTGSVMTLWQRFRASTSPVELERPAREPRSDTAGT